MALKQIPPTKDGSEQLSFKAFELAEVVARLIRIEAEKKETNEEFNAEIKACKRSILKLSAEIEGQRGADYQSREKDS